MEAGLDASVEGTPCSPGRPCTGTSGACEGRQSGRREEGPELSRRSAPADTGNPLQELGRVEGWRPWREGWSICSGISC